MFLQLLIITFFNAEFWEVDKMLILEIPDVFLIYMMEEDYNVCIAFDNDIVIAGKHIKLYTNFQ